MLEKSEKLNTELKELVSHIYSIGYKVATDRCKFNSELEYNEWVRDRPNYKYLEALEQKVEEIKLIFEKSLTDDVIKINEKIKEDQKNSSDGGWLSSIMDSDYHIFKAKYMYGVDTAIVNDINQYVNVGIDADDYYDYNYSKQLEMYKKLINETFTDYGPSRPLTDYIIKDI